MALHLIISGLLKLLNSKFLQKPLRGSVPLLNFAVLLSYPINFFIYCRMSRAFRDAFTKLLCPSFIESRQQRLHSIATPLLAKHSGTLNNNDQFEHNNAHIEMEKLPSSSVILKATTTTTTEVPMSLLSSTTCQNNNHLKKNSIESLGKSRVSFGDDVNPSTNTELTDS
jgi:hypothetical protein